MKQLADGVWRLRGFPPNGINVYLVEDVVIDAATRRAGRRTLKQVGGHRLSAHALTHAHPDHQGASDLGFARRPAQLLNLPAGSCRGGRRAPSG